MTKTVQLVPDPVGDTATALEALQKAIGMLKPGEPWEGINKVFIIGIDPTKGNFNVHFVNGNCGGSEILAALTCTQAQTLACMRYSVEAYDIDKLREELGI
jgi:hypothetical protein